MTTATRTDTVLVAVELERQRQDKLFENGKIPWNLTDVTIDDSIKLSVLMEEIGEVARELNETNGVPHQSLYNELVQVAAVSVAWAESIQELIQYMDEASGSGE